LRTGTTLISLALSSSLWLLLLTAHIKVTD